MFVAGDIFIFYFLVAYENPESSLKVDNIFETVHSDSFIIILFLVVFYEHFFPCQA